MLYYTSFGWRNCSPENSIWNTAVPLLSYSCMFQVGICSQQFEICNSVCMFIASPLLWRMINFRLFCSDDCRSWPRDEKIKIMDAEVSTHTFLAMIIEESVCFMSCEPFFILVQLFLCGTRGIYFYLHPTFFSSTEQCTWAIISPERVQILGHAHIICITVHRG